ARTWTLRSEGASTNEIVAVGLHGDALEFAHGSYGGWKPFGPVRRITRCNGNIVYEIDQEPALVVYQRYLGDHARDLPASGLLFPFAIVDAAGAEAGPIRTILAVDREAGSLTLAGAVDVGSYLRLMHADTDRLVGGATTAAEVARTVCPVSGVSLAVLVSCIGRKLVMGNRVGEEVAAVSRVLGRHSTLTGFYSYGEISPRATSKVCGLHNQTMTISWLGEN
ncbi:MAG TPA: FIST C-terminal domain-containing protein, partial [Burkholderiaceae bacterium]|nr:FIST C-terminal domain-containing protein [Burkholderiaceae bacterium]